MVMALGEVYEKLERLQEAKKCYWKAHSLGDVEGLALIKLAKLVLTYGSLLSKLSKKNKEDLILIHVTNQDHVL